MAFPSVVSNRIVFILITGVLSLGAAVFLMRKTWPVLYSTLIAYGLAARIPVVLIMFFAIMGNWGTHYDGPPPDFPETAPFVEWLLTGLIPQLTFWFACTIIVGDQRRIEFPQRQLEIPTQGIDKKEL